MSEFDSVELLPSDPIFSLPILFAEDKSEKKVNLGIGSYKDIKGNPEVMACVHKAEYMILERQLNKEYLPIAGDPDYISLTLKLIFGETYSSIADRTFGMQTVGGTGALRLLGNFLTRNKFEKLYLPKQTWPNHSLIFSHANLPYHTYEYYDSTKRTLNFEEMMESIRKMPRKSVILLHASCHNPTGIDPSMQQWQDLSTYIKQRELIPFFDVAYQGFGQNLDEDVYAVRHFAQQGHEMLVAYSYAKNMGLYGERAGALAFVGETPDTKERVASHLKQIARSTYSNPPLQGARIVSTVLDSDTLTHLWKNELESIRQRIAEMRQALKTALDAGGYDTSHLTHQQGMFSYLDLSEEQVKRLQSEYGLYVAERGRINIAGLNWENIDDVVAALNSVVER